MTKRGAHHTLSSWAAHAQSEKGGGGWRDAAVTVVEGLPMFGWAPLSHPGRRVPHILSPPGGSTGMRKPAGPPNLYQLATAAVACPAMGDALR
jgi:hypothetical protein